jgi:uncharacterized protein YjiS (DUF1127 family)
MSAYSSVEALLTHLRERWRAREELAQIDPGELARIAGDLGMTAEDLETLAERGPDAANLLYERMAILGITPDDAENAARGLLRDLEKTCACCNEKGVCEKDIARRPGDPRWHGYCPNALELEDLKRLKEGR